MSELLRSVAIVTALVATYEIAYQEGKNESEVVVEIHDTDCLY